MTATFVCDTSDLHPYECGGDAGGCVHCSGEVTADHDPDTCELCEWLGPHTEGIEAA